MYIFISVYIYIYMCVYVLDANGLLTSPPTHGDTPPSPLWDVGEL